LPTIQLHTQAGQIVAQGGIRERIVSRLILGTEKPDPAVLQILRERLKLGQQWFAYQNHAMDSESLGEIQFLCCGPDCTFAEPPQRMPDSHLGVGWKYLLVGTVNLETGEIEEGR
jgi:hypothetical protein